MSFYSTQNTYNYSIRLGNRVRNSTQDYAGLIDGQNFGGSSTGPTGPTGAQGFQQLF